MKPPVRRRPLLPVLAAALALAAMLLAPTPAAALQASPSPSGGEPTTTPSASGEVSRGEGKKKRKRKRPRRRKKKDRPKGRPKGGAGGATSTPAPTPAPSAVPAASRPPTIEERGGRFAARTTEHYRILVEEGAGPFAEGIGETLERQRVLFFELLGEPLGLESPPERMTAVVFRSASSYASYRSRLPRDIRPPAVTAGLYDQERRCTFLFDQRTTERSQEEMRKATEKTRADILRTIETRNAEIVVHEATHQLAHESGLLPLLGLAVIRIGRTNYRYRYHCPPRWLGEGMATYFECAAELERRPGEPLRLRNPGQAAWAKLVEQETREATKRDGGGPLAEVVGIKTRGSILDRLGSEAKVWRFYGVAWSLFSFLMDGEEGQHRKAFFRYMLAFRKQETAQKLVDGLGLTPAELKKIAAGGRVNVDDARFAKPHRALFEEHLGPIERIEPAWRRYVRSLPGKPAWEPPRPKR